MKQEEMVNYFYSSMAGGQLSRYKANSGIWWTYSSLKIGDNNKLRCFFHFITHDQVFKSKMTVLQLWGQGSKMIFFSIYPMLGQSVIDKV